jgi:MFS family permease
MKRFFYGYIIVFSSFVILMMTFGINYSFGVFFKPLIATFGWDRGTTSGAYSVMTFMAGFLGIFAGKIADQFGPKMIGVCTGLFLGIGFILLSRINTLWHFYLVYTFILAAGVGAVWPGLVPSLARWFVARRGLMTGIMASGIGCGTFAFPPLADWIISAHDWRKAYLFIGSIVLVLIVLISQLLKKDPALVGQTPLGEETAKEEPSKHAEGLIFGDALRTGPFMLLCIIYFCYGYALHSIMVHIVPHAMDLGLPSTSAAGLLSIIGVISIFSRILIAGLSDRIGVKPALIIVFSILLISLLWVPLADKKWGLQVFGLLFGTSYGGIISLQALAVAELFGLVALGQILGTVVFAYTIGAALGPVATGYLFDITNSYVPGFWGAGTLAVAALILVFRLRLPSEPT